MKQIVVLFTLISVLFATSFDVEARKKFGSKKKGKTHQTQTVQQKKQVDTKAIAPAKKKSSKKGIMAGIFGGLLAGGLIAAMMGDDFEGFQILEMLMFAVLAFIIFKVIRSFMAKKQQPSFAGAQQFNQPNNQFNQNQFKQSASSQSGGFAQQTQQEAVPFNLPRDFDINGFLQGAREHYHTIQKAWNNKDYSTMAEYLSPELVEEFRQEREQQDNVATEVMFVDAEMVRADSSPSVWEISIKFTGKYRDLGDMQEEPILEIWHLERKNTPDAPWLIVGVEDLVD